MAIYTSLIAFLNTVITNPIGIIISMMLFIGLVYSFTDIINFIRYNILHLKCDNAFHNARRILRDNKNLWIIDNNQFITRNNLNITVSFYNVPLGGSYIHFSGIIEKTFNEHQTTLLEKELKRIKTRLYGDAVFFNNILMTTDNNALDMINISGVRNRNHDIQLWLQEFTTGKFYMTFEGDLIWFQNKEDAVLFKMVWI